MPRFARFVVVPTVALALLASGCGQEKARPRATAENAAASRTDSVPATTPAQAAPPRNDTRPVADSPNKAPVPAQLPQLPQLPFPVPALPAGLPPLPFRLPSSPVPSVPVAPKVPAPQPVSASRVTVFGIQGCGACGSLKSKLAARSVPYQYVDIDAAKRETVPSQAWGRVPKTRVIQRNGAVTWVEGDDAEKIERAYRS